MRRPVLPLLRQGGRLLPATLDQALLRAAELLADQAGGQCGVQAAPTLSNAAIIALDRALRPALCGGRIGFQPSVHTPWLVQGRIANLPNCKKAVLLGLDPWTELPVLALWLRKAAVAGGSVVAVGPKNGLFRDTAAWLQVAAGKVRPALAQLLAALDGKGDDAAVIAAAGKLQRDGAAAVLLHPDLAADAETLAMAQQLGKRLGADAATGLLGAPAFGANARGAQELAPALASHAVATAGLRALLLLGVETLPPAGTARLIVASSRAVPDRDDVEVVLPLAHSYESQGTFTNLEGQQQTFAAGGFAGRHVVADHVLIGSLAAALARDLQRSR
jgi:NADH dehydrogenase/NADH:ubiquinone oxidoreductase subunit G